MCWPIIASMAKGGEGTKVLAIRSRSPTKVGEYLFSGDRRKSFQEIINRFTALQIFDQCLNRYTGVGKNGRTSQYIW